MKNILILGLAANAILWLKVQGATVPRARDQLPGDGGATTPPDYPMKGIENDPC